MSAPDVVVFDLMDTLVVDPFFADVLPRLRGRLCELQAAQDRTTWPAFERGELDEATFLRAFYRAGETPAGLLEPVALRDLLHAGYRFVPGMQELLCELRAAGVRLWVLSNYPCWFEVVRKRLDLERFFEGFVISYRSGVRKPERAAYVAAERAIGSRPEALLLIDDRAENCEGARRAGWQAVVFEGLDALETSLERAGVSRARAPRGGSGPAPCGS